MEKIQTSEELYKEMSNESGFGYEHEKDKIIEAMERYAEQFRKSDVSGNEANQPENKKDGEVAVAFAKWITVYASQLGNGWVMVKGTEPIMMTSEQLFEEYKTQMAKATDR